MQIVPHPLVRRDVIAMAEHIYAVSGDGHAARRRIEELHELLSRIQDHPDLGSLLAGDLDGWRIRHGGKRRQISVVYRYDIATDRLYLALVAFGGQDWAARAQRRRDHFSGL